jgi:CheY-like chemotaxis protein
MPTLSPKETSASLLRVLAVDDQTVWQNLIQRRLQKDGRFEVSVVGNIKEARELLGQMTFHIVILDINLDDQGSSPNKDGMVLLAELHKRGWIGKSMMVVMLSGNEVISNITEAYSRYGVTEFIQKDIFQQDDDPQAFAEKLCALFQQVIPISLNLDIQWQSDQTRIDAIRGLEIDGTRLKRPDEPLYQRALEDLDHLLRRLFHDASGVILRPMIPGKSGTRVLLAQPLYTTGAGRAYVVKYGDLERIQEEVDAYRKFVFPFSAGNASTHLVYDAATTLQGGIVYGHIGSIDHRIEDFDTFYQTQNVASILKLIRTLFKDICGDWYVNRLPPRGLNLTRQYQELLGFTTENLQQAMDERLRSVQGKKELVFNNLSLAERLPNPVPYAEVAILRPTHECITHGDLNQHNILIDTNNSPWLIDFRKTKYGHILGDIACLDCVVRYQLLAQSPLSERYKMEIALLKADSFAALAQLRDEFISDDEAIMKAYHVVIFLRQLAGELTTPLNNTGLVEYYTAIFYHSLNTIRYYEVAQVQREHALLCASLLVKPLNLA